MNHSLKLAGAVGAIILIAGCGGVTPDASYSSAESLRDALHSEGFRCTGGEPVPIADGYGEELTCDEGTTVGVWDEDMPDYADDPGMTVGMASALFGGHSLVADDWLIMNDNAALIGEIAPIFGGTYYGSDDELRCEYNENAQDC